MPKAVLLFLVLASSLAVPGLSQTSTARPAITGISHLTLYADNLPSSEKFYSSVLGWDRIPPQNAGAGPRYYANHLQYVELIAPSRPHFADRLAGVGFLTADANALRLYLGAHGVQVPAAVTTERDGSRSFLVHDPEGNQVAFTQPGSHPPAQPANAGRSLSNHIMHAGYVVRNSASLDRYYKDLLGFHLYWQGGNPSTRVDWVMMQVPDGTDWIEYMLYLPEHPTLAQLGSANHLAPGVVSVADLQKKLEARGWKFPQGKNPQVLGVDGKMQLDLTDPDGTRVEFMEFAPVQTACCSPYTGAQPKPSSTW